MKYLLIIAVLFSACSSKKDNILSDAETYLKTRLKDPASYSPIEKKITDTLMVSEAYRNLIEYDSLKLQRTISRNKIDSMKDILAGFSAKESEEIRALRQKGANIYRESLASNSKQLSENKIDSIESINMYFNYRAKNGVGALDLFESNVRYYPRTKAFEMDKAE